MQTYDRNNFQHRPRKRFGQHFLHDQNIMDRIVQAIAPKPTDHLVEIGPGKGALTTLILPLVHSMDVVELDRDLIPYLASECEKLGKLEIYQASALDFDFTKLAKSPRELRVFGNLPYNISTPLLFHLLEQEQVIKDMHFMLQKEVVDRMVAKPGGHDYGRLSVMMQYHCKMEKLFLVGRHAFTPPPQVESAVLRLIPHDTLPVVAQDTKILSQVVRQAFNQRRKMLHNTLNGLITTQELINLEINPNQRPEQLTVADYVKISNFVSSRQS